MRRTANLPIGHLNTGQFMKDIYNTITYLSPVVIPAKAGIQENVEKKDFL